MAVSDPILKRVLKLDPFPQPEVITTRYPVVLMHGFGVLGSLGKAGQMHKLAMDLRQHCTVVVAPNVAPYTTVAARAQLWHERVHTFLADTKAEKVNIIAHSMGGLDARYFISVLGGGEFVASLTTISTPHRGSPFASYILEQPDQVKAWLCDILDWIGETAYADLPSTALKAISELTPEYLANEFNPMVENVPGVLYQSYAGIAGKGTTEGINPFLRIPNAIIYKRGGLNDGLVPLESAKWGIFRGSVEADHAREIGLLATTNGFDAVEFFVSLVKQLRDASL